MKEQVNIVQRKSKPEICFMGWLSFFEYFYDIFTFLFALF